jgi:hypothetical protein
MMRTTTTLVTVVAATLLAAPLTLAGPAYAGHPAHFTFSADIPPSEFDTICRFPVLISATVSAWGISFDGKPQDMTIAHVTETDTFVGPSGHTLVGLPWSGTTHSTDNGPNFAAGTLEVIPLNDGTVFRSIGRVDFNAFTGDFALTRTSGHSGDVAELCAELAP